MPSRATVGSSDWVCPVSEVDPVDAEGETIAAPDELARLTAIVHVTALGAVATASDLPTAFRSFVEVVRPLAWFDGACVVQSSPEGGPRVAAAEGPVDWQELQGPPLTRAGRRGWEQLWAGESGVVLETTSPSLEPAHQALARAGVRSYLSVPVVAVGEVQAVVLFAATRPESFDGDRRRLLEGAVRSVASAFRLLLLLDGEREAVARLRERSIVKDDFVSTVVHELRSPLTVITGLGELLEQGRVRSTEEQLTLLSRIVVSSKRVSRLVDAVLDVARLDSGVPVRDPVAFDLGALVRGLVTEAARAQPGRSCRAEVPDGLPAAFGDPEACVRVVTNLLSTAQRYSEDDAPLEVVVRARRPQLQVEIGAGGPGVDSDAAPRLLECVSPDRGSAEGSVPGTDLGLDISKRLVEAQGGSIWAESTAGGGQRVCFTVPIAGEER